MRCASVRLTIFLIVRACAPQVFTSLGVDVTGGVATPRWLAANVTYPPWNFSIFVIPGLFVVDFAVGCGCFLERMLEWVILVLTPPYKEPRFRGNARHLGYYARPTQPDPVERSC